MAIIEIDISHNTEHNNSVKQQLHECLVNMSDSCNFATTRDGIGFSRNDAEEGHQLATEDPLEWSDEKAHEIWIMLRKYANQLQREWDIDFQAIGMIKGIVRK